jgi:uncharacterized membrane protein YfcA
VQALGTGTLKAGESLEWMQQGWPVIAWIVVVTMLAGYIQGLLGVGYPMLATPLLSLVVDLRTAVIVTVPTILFLSAYLIFRGGNLRESVARFWYMPPCMVVGAMIGARIFLAVDPSWLLLSLGIALLMYVSLDWLGRAEFRGARRFLHPGAVVCATLAGVSESAINVGGPFLLIWCLVMGLAPVTLIQVLNLCFLTGKTTQVAALTAGGVPVLAWVSAAPLAIAALLPFRLGIRMRERADIVAYRRWLRAFLSLMAFLMVARFVQQAWL